MIQLILSILALITGAVFTLFIPGTSVETTVIALITGLAGAVGITNWREKYDSAKAWFVSKTKTGAILVVVSIILVAILPLFTTVPETIFTLLNIIIVSGGGTTLWGIFDIIEKKTANKL